MKTLCAVVRRLRFRAIQWLYNQLTQTEQQLREEEKERLKTQFSHCGWGVKLNGRITVTGASSIAIGNNVHIGDNAFIRGDGGLEIGDNTHISRNLVLYTINHDYLGSRLPYDEKQIKKPVRIGQNVWIGMNVCIAPGTTIGDGAIVGMGTVVFGEVPALAIVGCSMWRQIGERERGHYLRLVQAEEYGGVSGWPLDWPSPAETL